MKSKVSEENPENTGKLMCERQKQMSDVALARTMIRDIGGTTSVNDMIYRAAKKLQKLFPHEGNARLQWSERRLRGWWNGESDVVRHCHMVELFEAAEKAKAERELIAQARKEHAEFITRTAHLKAMLEHQDEAFHGPQIEGMGGKHGGMDRTRTEG